MDDIQIINLYFERNEDALKETETKYGKQCFRIAYGILSDESDAKECVNDAYLNVWNTIPPTRPDSLSAFLSKIVRNLSLNRLTYLNAQKRSRIVAVSLEELEDMLPDERLQSEMENKEISKRISDFLRSKDETPRNVFIRKYWYFDSVAAIAARYAISQSQVKVMLHRTRNQLRDYLKKEGIYL